jgi:ribosomal protein S18 acetylase RimI-like enzyme
MSGLHLTTTVKVRTSTLSLDISVQPATPDRWNDVDALFAGQGGRGCWCQYWRQSSTEYGKAVLGSGERNLRRQVREGPAPGVLAYMEGIPVGWLGFWPREKMERLVRSSTIPKVDDVPVWAIVCFMVRTGYRRKGVAEALLRGAIAHARAAGVPVLEA